MQDCDFVCCFFYGCEAWSVILREEHSLRVFENTALRGMFGPVREQATGNWRRMYNEEPRDFSAH
jgi:hypothetical protein